MIRFGMLGHVDHGKSTLAGRMLVDTGNVDERELEKLKKKAEENKKGSWYLSYLLDIDDVEREKGKTFSFNIFPFSFKEKKYELIDVPGHLQYISEMINGTSYADVCLLVISIRKGEYEQGLSGQTIEHLKIARGMGLKSFIVVINKMDEINWNINEYNKFVNELDSKSSILRKIIGKTQKINYVPVSALHGQNITEDFKDFKNLFDVMASLNIEKKKEPKEITVELTPKNKKVLGMKCLFFTIPKVLSAGLDFKLHSNDRTFDCKIIKLIYKYKTKDNKIMFKKIITQADCEDSPHIIQKDFNVLVEVFDEQKETKVFDKYVLRTGDMTIGCGIFNPKWKDVFLNKKN